MKYKITGTFGDQDAPGYNIWHYLPEAAYDMLFDAPQEAIAWANANSLGPDQYGVDVIWGAKEVEECDIDPANRPMYSDTVLRDIDSTASHAAIEAAVEERQ